jgi:DNA-binding response OmpR family regulator
MAERILIIEDEPALASLLADYLAVAGYSSEQRHDGIAGLQAALDGGFDLVLLDVMLPGMDGLELCRALRARRDMPVLMVSARREDADKIRGLGLGADDYITKPFSPAELVARVRSHLARYQRLTGKDAAESGHWVGDGGLRVSLEGRRVLRAGAEVNLTVKEFDLLALFLRNPDRVFSKDELYDRVWGDEQYGDQSTVTVHIRRLREKVETDPSNPVRIQTVWGLGYRWRPG